MPSFQSPFLYVNQLFAEAMDGDTQERTLQCGLNLSDIKSLLPGEDLNDKGCNRKLKNAPQEHTPTLSVEPVLSA